jgi:hypothetical protein
MKTSTIVVMGILGLAATPLALHLAGGSSETTKNWVKTLHGGGSTAGHGSPEVRQVPQVLQVLQVPQVPQVPQVQQVPGTKAAPKSETVVLSGKWDVTIQGDQGTITSTMVLKQDGAKITGTFANPHADGNLTVAGEFVNGRLTLNADATADHGDMHLTFKGAPKDDGSLAGTMTSAMGEATWTAARAKN